MGCFDYTCSISGISIGAGTPVRFLPVVNGYGGNWMPLCPPIKGKYNDYGSLEDYDEDSVFIKVFKEVMKNKVIEKPLGENEYHDPRVDSEMSMKRWLDALWESRVYVKYTRPVFISEKERKEVPGKKGQPSAKRIEAQLEKAGFAVAAKEYPKGTNLKGIGNAGFCATEFCHGFVQVRWKNHRYDHKEEKAMAKELKKALGTEYATVLVPSNDSHGVADEVLVFPKPNSSKTKDYNKLNHLILKFGESPFDRKEEAVRQSMIREDVWNYLLNMEMTSWRTKEKLDLEYYKKSAREVWDAQKKIIKENESKGWMKFYLFESGADFHDNPVHWKVAMSGGSHSNRWLKYTWKTAIDLDLTETEVEEFLEGIAELARVEDVCGIIRHQWREGSTSGPQHGEYKYHIDFHQGCADISRAILKRQREDWGDFEEDESE